MRNYLTNRRDNTFDFFDDVFDTFFQPVLYTGRNSHIRADIKENEKEYEFSVDLPGFDKKDIELTLSDGYLIVNAKKQEKYFRVATEYLLKKGYQDKQCRFDVIEIENGKINHIIDAFSM